MRTRTDGCPMCELDMSESLSVVSRHRTSTGTVVYARCACGRLSVWRESTVTMNVRLSPMDNA